MCSKYTEMTLPSIDISKGSEDLYTHKDWILEWNMSYFKNPENNIVVCISNLETEIKLNTLCQYSQEYLKIILFRISILKEVKKNLSI